MKISVVTAVYNRVDTVAEAVRSVQAQKYKNVEHVIQDGASTDGTLEKLHTLADARTRLESGKDAGLYDAINLGIKRTSGDAIGLMHSDDVFAGDETLSQVASAFSDPEIDGVYGDLQYVSAANPNRVVRYWRSGDYERFRLRRGWMPPHPTLYLRRKVFEEWGAYDTSLRIAADYDAMLRWLIKGNIRLAYIPRVLVKMRLGGESNASLEQIIRKTQEDYRVIRRHNVGGLGTLAQKNLRKFKQFINKDFTPR